MKTVVRSPGDVLTVTAPAAVKSGDGVLIGALFGVAMTDAESGKPVAIAVRGEFTLPKATGAIAVGDRVFWDATNKNVNKTASGNYCIGVATTAAANADATVNVVLMRVPPSGS